MKVVSVTEFGVIPGVEMVQTEKIQSAIDFVFSNGGGEVQIPSGEYYITALRLRSGVCLHLLENAILMASRNAEDYFILKNDKIEPVDPNELNEGPAWNTLSREHKEERFVGFHTMGSRWHNGIIRALNAEDISIIGEKGSVIDGRNCYDEIGEEYYRGPHGISIINCDNIVLRGYTVRHSGNWANMLQHCSNIVAENLIVEAGHDGIHLTSCDNIKVQCCQFYTGDDSVAGFDINNMLVENCILNSACSAFRLGGTNILIQNCHAYAPAKYMFRYGIVSNEAKDVELRYNMLSFFTYTSSQYVVIRNKPENIIIRDCKVEGADRFLHFNYSGNEPWQCGWPLTQITFENIQASGISMPLTAYGDKDEQCSLTLKNINFSFREGFERVTFMHAANLRYLCMKDITVQNADGGMLVKLWGDIVPEIEMENINGNIVSHIIRTNEEFTCTPV